MSFVAWFVDDGWSELGFFVPFLVCDCASQFPALIWLGPVECWMMDGWLMGMAVLREHE